MGEQDSFPFFLIGASAGGLEPLIEIVKNVRFETPKAIIIAQHLSPTANSMLVDILNRSAIGEVRFARDQEVIQPGSIYIIPPDTNAIVRGRKIELEDAPQAQISPKPSIDRLFSSVAESANADKVGIILSGTGSDGTQGLEAIRSAGGVIVAQDPLTAKFESMPLAAINHLGIQHVLSPAEIATLINNYPASVEALRAVPTASGVPDLEKDPLKRLLYLLLIRSGVDFTAYRQSTIERRLEKFMLERRLPDLTALFSLADRDQKAILDICNYLFIPVTSFFRDAEAFAELKKHVGEYLRRANRGSEFRAWIVGCSTGQEVYSLLIMVLESFKELAGSKQLRIFATDISEVSLAIARVGAYPDEEFAGFDPELLDKYFRPTASGHQIKQAYRDLVVFSRHDILKSPPLARMDFICCRNLLIYFTDHHQEQVLEKFANSLYPEAVLFLGKSESLRESSARYRTLNGKWKIFQRKADALLDRPLHGPALASTATRFGFVGKRSMRESKPESLEQLGRRYLVRQFAPASLVYDRNWKIHFVFGDMEDLLRFREGEIGAELLNLLPDEIRAALVYLTAKAARESGPEPVAQSVFMEQAQKKYSMTVVDMGKMGKDGYFLATILPILEKAKLEVADEMGVVAIQAQRDNVLLEQELQETREYVQTVVEELEASNEELQSVNEEMQASNEELQASNEELESTNEELQASNEELNNVNGELQEKTRLLEQAASKLESIQNSTGYPMVVVDRQNRILTQNRSFDEFFPAFKLKAIDRVLDGGFGSQFNNDLLKYQERVWQGALFDFEISVNQQIFSVKLAPYFDKKGSVDGIVISFIDQTQLITIRNRLSDSDAKLSALINNAPALISIKDISGRYALVNGAFEDYFGIARDRIFGELDTAFLPKAISDKIRAVEFQVIQQRARLSAEETLPTKKGNRTFLINRFIITDQRDHIQGLGSIAIDITESIETKGLVDRQKRDLERLAQLAAIGQFSASVAHEINNPLAILSGEFRVIEKTLERSMPSEERLQSFLVKGRQAIERITTTISALRKFTKDFNEIDLKPTKAKDIVAEAYRPNENFLQTHNVDFQDATDDSLTVMADLSALSLVLSNLFRNAVEANKTRAHSWIKVWADRGEPGHARIFVQDCGDGIPKELQERILDSVYSTKGGSNMGIGLKLTKQIVSAHGGQLKIDESYKNTTFVVDLNEAPA